VGHTAPHDITNRGSQRPLIPKPLVDHLHRALRQSSSPFA
jgi:hypothetical protein